MVEQKLSGAGRKSPKGYTNISIPTSLVERVHEVIVIEHPEFGYRTASEYIIEVLREHLTSMDSDDDE